MGKPATTYWCYNGHLLEDNPHHVLGKYDLLEDVEGEYLACTICSSKKWVCVVEWHEEGGRGYPPRRWGNQVCGRVAEGGAV